MNYNALVINTASDITEVVVIKGKEKFYKAQEGKNKTSKVLFPLIDELMNESGLQIQDLNYLGCVVGPGSFTGIRIGVTAVRAMAYVHNIKCVPVTYFDMLAYNFRGQKIAVVTDAGNGVCYVSADNQQTVMKEVDALEFCKANSYIVVTNKRQIEFENINYTDGDLIGAFCESIDKACDYDQIVPIYLRKPQAERREGDL